MGGAVLDCILDTDVRLKQVMTPVRRKSIIKRWGKESQKRMSM
jgi:hypothetical protein